MKDKNLVKEKSQALIKTHAYYELKDIAQKFVDNIDAITSEMEKDYENMLKECIEPIEEALAFCKSDKAKEMFGEDTQKTIVESLEKDKSNGAKYCTCEACTVAKEILYGLTGEKIY